MDYKHTINAILKRAARLNVDKRDLCRAAEISASTLYRWQQDDANPRLRDLQEALAKMERHLNEKEDQLRRWLANSNPERRAEA
jgi:transcriptional regulator with XRE-family HTH domain